MKTNSSKAKARVAPLGSLTYSLHHMESHKHLIWLRTCLSLVPNSPNSIKKAQTRTKDHRLWLVCPSLSVDRTSSAPCTLLRLQTLTSSTSCLRPKCKCKLTTSCKWPHNLCTCNSFRTHSIRAWSISRSNRLLTTQRSRIKVRSPSPCRPVKSLRWHLSLCPPRHPNSMRRKHTLVQLCKCQAVCSYKMANRTKAPTWMKGRSATVKETSSPASHPSQSKAMV